MWFAISEVGLGALVLAFFCITMVVGFGSRYLDDLGHRDGGIGCKHGFL